MPQFPSLGQSLLETANAFDPLGMGVKPKEPKIARVGPFGTAPETAPTGKVVPRSSRAQERMASAGTLEHAMAQMPSLDPADRETVKTWLWRNG